MGTITTSLVIDFDTGSDGLLKAEIDDREDGYNGGITSFVPGDSPVFLLFYSSNVTVTRLVSSIGSLSQVGSGYIEVGAASDEPEFLTFADSREASLNYPNNGSFSSTWYGGGGSITATETKVLVDRKAIGALKVEYRANFRAYRLNGVPLSLNGSTTFPVVIFVSGVVV